MNYLLQLDKPDPRPRFKGMKRIIQPKHCGYVLFCIGFQLFLPDAGWGFEIRPLSSQGAQEIAQALDLRMSFENWNDQSDSKPELTPTPPSLALKTFVLHLPTFEFPHDSSLDAKWGPKDYSLHSGLSPPPITPIQTI